MKGIITGAAVCTAFSFALVTNAFAQNNSQSTGADAHTTQGIEVQAPRVANTEPVGSFAMPVTQLRFEPLVDVQSRNLAEAQGDISIRGGIFTETDLQLGAISIYDPQTGHYFAELPLDPLMLSVPKVLTGAENAFTGFNSTAGTVQYSLMPITRKVEVQAGGGSRETNLQRGYAGDEVLKTDAGTLGVDLSAARSESAGTRENGRYEFARFSGRTQWRTERTQTDFLGGYQAKDFAWPNLYALEELHTAVEAGQVESEALRSTLAFLNHRNNYSDDGSYVEASGYFRRQGDNYEFDTSQPGLFNPYEHKSKSWSGGVAGQHVVSTFEQAPVGLAVKYDGQYLYDDLDSTAITYAGYSTRSYEKMSVMPEWSLGLGAPGMKAVVDTGLSYDDTNRDGSAVSPILKAAVVRERDGDTDQAYVSYSKATRVSDYTAIGSNPNAGLFRGNQALARQRDYTLEGGFDLQRGNKKSHTAVFYRRDLDLTDWTYDSSITPFASRSANNVDVDTFGVEEVLEYRSKPVDLIFGYTYLDKSEDYGAETIDASFYALNFARHRFTLAVIGRITEEFQVKVDNEYRRQYANSLRDGTDNPFLTYASVSYLPSVVPGLELSAVVDNPFKVNFEEVPGVPGEGRLAAFVGTYRWE